MGVTQQTYVLTAVIANGASLSGAVNAAGGTLVGIQMDSAWTSAGIALAVAVDGATFQPLYTVGGSEYTITAAASHYIALDPALAPGLGQLKIRSGTAASPVTQGAARTLLLVFRGM